MPDINDIASIRRALGRSQGEMAALLGLSIRAIQSYEQGWRATPSYVKRLGALLVYLEWRKTHHDVSPCWEIVGCSEADRATCYAYQMRAGDLCWLVSGMWCVAENLRCWKARESHCDHCEVVARWLGQSAMSTEPADAVSKEV